MPTISDDDYRSLELKLHAEVSRIFSQFMEDREKNARENGESEHREKQEKPAQPGNSPPSEKISPQAGSKKPRRPKKTIDVDILLSRPSAARKNQPGELLESDMNKIFRKKHRR